MDSTLVRVAHDGVEGTALLPVAYLETYETGWYVVDDTPDALPGALPARSASKSQWVDYAEKRGMDRDQAEQRTRDALAALYLDPADPHAVEESS